MIIQLSQADIDLAFKEFVQRRGLSLNCAVYSNIRAGRKGNSSTVELTICPEVTEVHKQPDQIYEQLDIKEHSKDEVPEVTDVPLEEDVLEEIYKPEPEPTVTEPTKEAVVNAAEEVSEVVPKQPTVNPFAKALEPVEEVKPAIKPNPFSGTGVV